MKYSFINQQFQKLIVHLITFYYNILVLEIVEKLLRLETEMELSVKMTVIDKVMVELNMGQSW